MKLQDAIDSNTWEMGVTSADKVISRINQNLHFFVGNGLCMEEFTEFKTTIRNLDVNINIHMNSLEKLKTLLLT